MSDVDLGTGTWTSRAKGGATSLHVRRCRIEVVDGPDKGARHESDKPVVRVGTRPGCDLVLTDKKISRHHFEIVIGETGYRLKDLGSKNGTFVGDHRVLDVYLHPGTAIDLGDTRLTFQPLSASTTVALSETPRFGSMIGESVLMRALFARLAAIAGSDTTVLVTGETGSGKELVADALHEASGRRRGPLVVLDCSSVAPNLFESELFGHERGAFTGAGSQHIGAFERANGGTLFLDEIGELPLDLQPKLLRAIENREVRRVGGSTTISIDARFISATNRDLAGEVNRGRFREDLYFRLAVVEVHVPPLRKRKEDIPLLARHILGTLSASDRIALVTTALEKMVDHTWPGNVRELRNFVECSLIALPDFYQDRTRRAELPTPPQGDHSTIAIDLSAPYRQARQELIDEFERRFVGRLLEINKYNISATARAAGVDRMSLAKTIYRLGLREPRST